MVTLSLNYLHTQAVLLSSGRL